MLRRNGSGIFFSAIPAVLFGSLISTLEIRVVWPRVSRGRTESSKLILPELSLQRAGVISWSSLAAADRSQSFPIFRVIPLV